MTRDGALDRLFDRLTGHGGAPAIIEAGVSHRYDQLREAIATARAWLDLRQVAAGEVIAIQSGFSLAAIALALALFRRNCVVAFLPPAMMDVDQALADVQADALCNPGEIQPHFRRLAKRPSHPLLDQLTACCRAGFIILSSGSSGRPRAVLHDLERFLTSYHRANKALTTLAFLSFDHIAGLDTLFYTLHAGGCLVLPPDRSPQTICALIERWRIEVLPTSPSFLKMLCLSGATAGRDLRSLAIVTYGSEPIDAVTLGRLSALLPHVTLKQKYGTSEFGSPRSSTRADGLWIRLESADLSVRVEAGVLWVRASTTMLGYLNAPPPLQRDGWLCTGDHVEVDGEWMRILGRQSDMINVGGEKVYPSEVEAVIGELDCIDQVAVAGAPHPMLGEMVTAIIRPRCSLESAGLRALVSAHCLRRLPRYKVPAKISFTAAALSNDRQKIIRPR